MPPHSAKANRPNGTLAVDLTGVTFIDQAGWHLLPLTHRDGVSVVVSDLMRQDISEEVAAPVTVTAADLAAIEAVVPHGASTQSVRSREESRMNGLSPLRIGPALVLGFCLGLAGCTPAPSGAPAPEPTPVTVSYPVEREVTDYADFTGRTAAVDAVDVRARVWGYLDKVNFTEGALVKKGDVLFEIDPRTYQAALQQAEGNLGAMEARLKRLDADLKRAQQLVGQRAMSQEEHDRIAGDRGETAASIRALQAAVGRAKLDLAFTKVTAPVSGRVGRAMVTVGNLVQSGESGGTVLTTIVSVDPVYVYFDVDERTVQRVRQLIREGKAKSARETEWPVSLGLTTDEGHPHRGTIDFVDNQVNPRTGTLRVRAVFPNKDEAISPGFFARVRVPVGFPRKALLVTDRAIDNDQGQRILYVVNDKNQVGSRPIRVGALHDGLREIEDGLRPGERVIVNGLQQVQPGVTVEPTLVDMPAARAARGPADTAQALKPEKP